MRWLGYLVMVITQFAVFGKLGDMPGPSNLNAGYLIILALMTFVGIFLHEMGHAAAVWRSGGTVLSINVAFLRYDVAKRKFEPAPRVEDREIGGYVAYTFDERRWTTRKDILVSAAGPAANVVTGLAALLLAFAAAPAPLPYAEAPVAITAKPRVSSKPPPVIMLPSDEGIEAAFANARERRNRETNRVLLAAFAILSFGLAFTNLVPFKGSDGESIYRAIRSMRRRR